MKKIEFIWRHILYETVEKRKNSFQQKELAQLFRLSSSTVHAALGPLRALGGIEVGGRGFRVVDFEKILYHWASHRRFAREISHTMHVALPVLEIEGRLPAGSIPTCYTAVRERFGEPPSDYEKVYCYHHKPQEILDRFHHESSKSAPNLFILPPDPFVKLYGDNLTLGHLFVDLWSMTDWYAKEFIKTVKGEIDGLLS